MWNIAHNMGGFAAPILAGTAAKAMGWQWGLFAPGIVGLVMGFIILAGVRDSPEAIGYPPVEIVAKKESKPTADGEAPEKKESLVDLLVNDCLKYVDSRIMTILYLFYIMKANVYSSLILILCCAETLMLSV